ncbi:MAG: outer membrane beta-barrel domain-containing protein [Proteobacteria bacterium]|nr:MAG: outer membrane beta-barrel domain-containing protein [Pseudomonadota bacterium]
MYSHLKTSTRSLIALLAFASVTTAGVSAQAQPKARPTPAAAPAPSATQGDKLDVTDLENKYWSAKDTDFNVVQNRLFSKAGRLALSLNYGMYVNEPWSEGATAGASLNYFFSERYGVELAYTNTDSRDTQATANLKTQQGGAPNHNKMKDFYGVAFNWVPFYAKVSVLNSKIIYFDMSFSPGVGMLTYEQQMVNGLAGSEVNGNSRKSTPAFTFDVTQHYFLNKWLALRVDYKNRWYREEITEFRAPSSGRTVIKDLNNTGLLMFGATLYW